MLEATLTYDQFTPPIEYRTGVDPNHARVRGGIEEIERVPDQLQKIIADQGGYIAFYNGPITDQPEFRYLKGKIASADGTTWDVLSGGYDPSKHVGLIGVDGNYIFQREGAALHEYGHGFNQLVGNFFFRKPLSKTAEVLEAIEKRPFVESDLNIPSEFVAYSVEMNYFSIESRSIFQSQQPEIYELFQELEEKSLKPDKFVRPRNILLRWLLSR